MEASRKLNLTIMLSVAFLFVLATAAKSTNTTTISPTAATTGGPGWRFWKRDVTAVGNATATPAKNPRAFSHYIVVPKRNVSEHATTLGNTSSSVTSKTTGSAGAHNVSTVPAGGRGTPVATSHPPPTRDLRRTVVPGRTASAIALTSGTTPAAPKSKRPTTLPDIAVRQASGVKGGKTDGGMTPTAGTSHVSASTVTPWKKASTGKLGTRSANGVTPTSFPTSPAAATATPARKAATGTRSTQDFRRGNSTSPSTGPARQRGPRTQL